MRLHWSPKSPYVRKVMVCVHELGLVERIECVRTVAAMGRPNPELMRDNPLSKIPTLMLVDGKALFDSPVICEYLNELAAGALVPPVGPERMQALQWQAFGDGLLDNLILWRNERERAEPVGSLLTAFEVKTRSAIEWLQRESQTLVDADFGIGQIAVGCALGYLDYRFESFQWRALAPLPAAWYAGVSERASFRATVPTDG